MFDGRRRISSGKTAYQRTLFLVVAARKTTGRQRRRWRLCKSRQTRVLVNTPLRRPNGQIWLPINFSNYLAYQLQLLPGDTALSSWPRFAVVGFSWRSIPNILWNRRVKKTVRSRAASSTQNCLFLQCRSFRELFFLLLLLMMNSWFRAKKGGRTRRSHVTCLPDQSEGGIANSGAEQHKEVRPLAYLPQVGLLDLPSARA